MVHWWMGEVFTCRSKTGGHRKSTATLRKTCMQPALASLTLELHGPEHMHTVDLLFLPSLFMSHQCLTEKNNKI